MNCPEKNLENVRIAVSCGGTGGHFYPGLSIAEVIKKEGGHVILLLSGVNAQQQKKIAESRGIDTIALPVMPHPKRPKNILNFFRGYFNGRKIAANALKEHDINTVIGMGSFASLPPLFAAKKLKKSIYLHDGNARIGKANRFLSRYAVKLWTAFDPVNAGKVKCPVSVIGMPLRPALTMEKRYSKAEALAELNSRFNTAFKADVPTLLIFGGSQGAQKINLVLPEYLKTLENGKCQIIHLAGPTKLEETRNAYNGCQIEHLLLESSSKMQLMYGAADMVISRSGGSSVAEIAFFGKAAILIPYPFAAENHQYDNARFLEKHGGAIILDNADCSQENFAKLIDELLFTPDKLTGMSEKSRSAHTHDSIYEILEEINQQ